jgi:pSer/pThr/pTyr-binding forkhead associated (FHA) protein
MHQATTNIESVTLYRNGALISRRGEAPPGPVAITGLPLLYASDSLRIRLDNAGAILNLEETCSLDGKPESKSEDEKRRRALEDELARLDWEMGRQEKKRRFLDGTMPGKPPVKDDEIALPNLEGWMSLNQWRKGEVKKLDALALAHQQKRREIQRELTDILNRFDADKKPPRFFRGLTFDLHADGESVPFEIEYFVEAARWYPSYRLELSGASAALKLIPHLAQASGEDWQGAELSFCTAELRRPPTSMSPAPVADDFIADDEFSVRVVNKKGHTSVLTFDKNEVTIGRTQGNDVLLPGGSVGKRHARVVLRDGKFIIVDLRSTNGTYVNGKRITAPQVLRGEDRIYIGDFTVQVLGSSRSPSLRDSTQPMARPHLPSMRAQSNRMDDVAADFFDDEDTGAGAFPAEAEAMLEEDYDEMDDLLDAKEEMAFGGAPPPPPRQAPEVMKSMAAMPVAA